jgi:hypothetical protein
VTSMPPTHQWLVERHNLSVANTAPPSPPAQKPTSPSERAASPTPEQASAAQTPTNFHSTGERSRERSESPPPRAPSPEAALDRAGDCAQGGNGPRTDVQSGQETAAVDGHDLAKCQVLAGGESSANKKCDSANSKGAGKGKVAPPVARNAPAAELLPLFSSLSGGAPPHPEPEILDPEPSILKFQH